MKRAVLFSFLLSSMLALVPARAQTAFEVVPFSSDRWKVEGEYKLEDYRNAQSLYLPQGGKALLPDAQFLNGIIEFDIAFSQERGFKGLRFRAQDDTNYEEFYFRSHQSGNPDAMQYTPVFNGVAAWQLYYGENHSTAYSYKDNEWMHIKLAVQGQQMEVFIDNMEVPVLYVYDLKMKAESGHLGLYSMGGVRFANFKYQPTDSYTFISKARGFPRLAAGTISNWEVSNAFAEEAIAQQPQLKQDFIDQLKWQKLESEFTGVTNLARVAQLAEGKNTVIAKVKITSDKKQLKKLEFGYSDVARVYCNHTILYEGQRVFRSRDYRYLGTIGYFDSIYLPLEKGENEIYMIVTENFGGWGIMARMEDSEGVALK